MSSGEIIDKCCHKHKYVVAAPATGDRALGGT